MTAADRPSVTDQALAEAWAEGHRTGWEHCQDGNYGNDHWDDPTPNPYAAAGRPSVTDNALAEACDVWDHGYRAGLRDASRGTPGESPNPYRTETTTGAIARGEALAAGDPDWMNVTRWPRTEAEATATILRLIEDNRRMRHGSLCPECNAKAWGERADFRRERDELAARLAAVEALVSEWERVQEQNRTALGELARGTTHLLLDTPGPADFRAALSAAPTDTTKEN